MAKNQNPNYFEKNQLQPQPTITPAVVTKVPTPKPAPGHKISGKQTPS